MKNLLLGAIALLYSLPLRPCGDYGYEDESAYIYRGQDRYFTQENIRDKQLYRFLRTWADWDFYYSANTPYPANANAVSWLDYWKLPTDLDHQGKVEQLVYYTPADKLEYILNNPTDTANWFSDLSKNQVLRHCLKDKKKLEALRYLLFAKEREDLLEKNAGRYVYAQPDDWSSGQFVSYTVADYVQVLKEVQQRYKRSKDPYLRLRYALFWMMLHRYAGQPEEALKVWEKYIEPNKKTSSYLYYRGMEHRAGILHEQGKPEGAYLFARIFNESPAHREVCLASFRLTSREQWRAALAYCQNDAERATFYALRGMSPGAQVVEEMDSIAALDVNSPYLELLLARTLNRAEWRVEWSEGVDGAMLARLEAFCAKMTANTAVQYRDLWWIGQGCAMDLQDKHAEARRVYGNVPKESPLYEQARLLDFVAYWRSLPEGDWNEAMELEIVRRMEEEPELRKKMEREVDGVLTKRYKSKQQWAQALLSNDYNWLCLTRNLNAHLLDSLRQFANQKTHTPLDKWYLQRKNQENPNWIADTWEMTGTYHLEHGNWDEAIRAFEQLPAAYRSQHAFYQRPRYLHKTLFHYSTTEPDYARPAEQQGKPLYDRIPFLNRDYNKLELAKMARHLEQRAKACETAKPDSAALYYFALGTLWTNLSPFGWHRPALSYYQDNYNQTEWTVFGTQPPSIFGNSYGNWLGYRYWDAARVMGYFEKAYQLSKDREWKAQIVFMQARIEQYDYLRGCYAGDPLNWAWPSIQDCPDLDLYQTKFQRLAKEFSDTEFYEQALGECSWFYAYVN